MLSRDTPVTPYTRPPVSTDSTTRDWPRDGNLTAICHIPPYSAIFRQVPPNSTKFHRILPSSTKFHQVPPNSAKFCQDHYLNPTLLRARVDQATELTIYTLLPRPLTFSPYATSWPPYTVYVYSLIISTLLYIIVAYTYSVTLIDYNNLKYFIL